MQIVSNHIRSTLAILVIQDLDVKIREYRAMLADDPEKVRMQFELLKSENAFIAS